MTGVKNNKLQAILDFFPGNSIVSKTAIASSLTIASTYAMQSGLYIPGEDTFAVAGFAFFVRLFYMKLGRPIKQYISNDVWSIRESFIKQRDQSRVETESQINLLESFRDNLDVNTALFEMKKENILLESDLSELKQKVSFLQSTKSKLNELIAQDRQRKEAERKAHEEAVKKELHNLLNQSGIQDKIMSQYLSYLERLPINRI